MNLPTRVMRSLSNGGFDTPREFDAMVNRLFHGDDVVAPRYAVDVREDENHLYIDAELPGFTKDQIDITLENSTLTIAAQHDKEKKDEKAGNYIINERRHTNFVRRFALPQTIDENLVQANLSNGLLHVVLNRREETKPRKITVA